MTAVPLGGLVSPRERSGEATRRRILEAAEHEFAARGFDGVRLAAIARSAEVPQALIHHHFGDKAGLYRAVIERVFGTIAAEGWRILETMAPPRRRARGAKFGPRDLEVLVEALVGMLVDFYSSYSHVLRLLRDEAVRGGTLADDLVKAHFRPQLDEIVARFEAMKEKGEVRADVDARHLCISTVAMACFPNLDEAFLGALWGIDPRAPEFLVERKREIGRTVLARLAV